MTPQQPNNINLPDFALNTRDRLIELENRLTELEQRVEALDSQCDTDHASKGALTRRVESIEGRLAILTGELSDAQADQLLKNSQP